MADKQWLARYGTSIYAIGSIAMLLVALGGAIVRGASVGVGVYVWFLYTLCSVPLLVLKRLNGRYALLGIFMGLYFVFFGALDFQHLLLGSDMPEPERDGFLTTAECAILLSAVLVLCGYFAGSRAGEREERTSVLAEWPTSVMLLVGVSLWLLGTAAMIYFQVFVSPEKTMYSAHRGMAAMGPLLTFVVMLGHMMQPLGILILSYGYARHRGPLWTTLILAVVSLQVAVGFVEDVKIQAIMGGALVIMCRTLVDNRLPKGWIFGGILFIIFAFPVFQAYREEVAGARGLDRAQAFRQLDKVIEIALASREKVSEGHTGQRAQTFIERASGKESLELLFQHVGYDVNLLYGRSLMAVPMAFVPRLLVPDKEDISVGQLFTKEVLKSDTDTYISISNLGELYWNFGWPAVFLGMPLIGLLLGFVGTRFNLENGTSLTRVLVLLVTAQTLCMGFGGTIPIAYIVWSRSMAAIGLMHLIFARRLTSSASSMGTESPMGTGSPTDPVADPPSGKSGSILPISVRFPAATDSPSTESAPVISLPVRFPAAIRELGAGGARPALPGAHFPAAIGEPGPNGARLPLPGPRFPNLMR